MTPIQNPFEAIVANLQQQRQAEAEAQLQEQRMQQQHLEELRKMLMPERDAQLAKVGGQFDPIIEQLLSQAQQPAGRPGDLNPSPWRDVSQAIANAFWMAQTGQKMESPVDARGKRLAAAQARKEQTLAQLRLMMEGKSKAEDRITDAYTQQVSQGLRERLAAEAAKMRQAQFDETMRDRKTGRTIAQGQLDLAKSREDRLKTAFSLSDLGLAAEAAKREIARRHGISPEEAETRYPDEFTKLRADELGKIKRAGGQGTTVTISSVDATGNPVKRVQRIPPPTYQPPSTPVVDNSGYAQKPPTIPNPATIPAGGRNKTAPITEPTQVPTTPSAPGKSLWRAPNGSGLQEIPRVTKSVADKEWVNTVEKTKFDTMEKGVQSISSILVAFSRLAEKDKLDEIGPSSALMKAEKGSGLLAALPWMSSTYNPGAGYARAKALKEFFGGSIDKDVDVFATALFTRLNQSIKDITGAAASNPEFQRIVLQEPTLGETPENFATKVMQLELLANLHSLRSGVFKDAKGDRIISTLHNTDMTYFIQDFSDFLGKQLATAGTPTKLVEQLIQPETLAQAQLAYAQAFQAGGVEEARKVLAGLKDAIRAQQMTKRLEKSIPDDVDFGDLLQ